VVGFIGNQKLGLTGERHRDHHALPHAAGHLVRILMQSPRGSAMPTSASAFCAISYAWARPTFWCSTTASAIWSPMV